MSGREVVGAVPVPGDHLATIRSGRPVAEGIYLDDHSLVGVDIGGTKLLLVALCRGYREAALETAELWSLPDSWRVCTVRPVRAGEAVVALGVAREAARASPT